MRASRSTFGWWRNGLAASTLFAVLAAVIASLVMFRPAYADHSSIYAVCPDPIPEGNTGQMGIRRSGYKIKSATIFTEHAYYTASSDDYEEYHGVLFESDSSGGDTTLRIPIVTKEDTLPEHDETFAIVFWDGEAARGCVVTIEDDDAPEINHVAIISEPADRYAYRIGESIDIAVEMDAKVEVDGTPQLALFLGNGGESTWRGATYHSGSGTRSLVFRYNVQPGDMDSDGISVGEAAVSEDRTPAYGFAGNIFAAGTDVPINYTHSGAQGDWRQKVDGRPYVQSTRITSSPSNGWEAYRANQLIEVTMTFDTDVVVEGDVSIDIYLGLENYNWDEAIRQADYIRGSGTDTLVFGYTVRTGDMDSKGVGIILGDEDDGFSGSGTIKGKHSGVERNPWYRGSGHQAEHKVDTEPPSVSSVRFASEPNNGEAYVAGEEVTVEVEFSEEVTPSGDVRLEIEVDGEARNAALGDGQDGKFSDVLVFEYTVLEGDTDTDGISVGANSVKLNSGGIHDSAGNSAALAHDAVTDDSGQKVGAITGGGNKKDAG